ncbi:hypothetical protein [Streptomyces sp. NPDC046712]|uniref:hypothetical protein n=1 Tax=Streptomyces sp. NPDC046712 TaxID=3154802 RepID=UPI00340EB2D1
MGAQPSSEQTGNEISGGSHVGGNAYQAKNIHFGGRSIGLTVVALALVAALVALALVLTNKDDGGPDQLAGAPAQSTAGQTPTPSPSASTPTPPLTPTPTATLSPSSTPKAVEQGGPGAAPKATSTVKPATGSRPFSGAHIYCGGWRSSSQSENLKVASCVQVKMADSSATFGVMVKNVGKSQVVVSTLVKFADNGTTADCPQGQYAPKGIRINPGGTWHSDLAGCAVSDLKAQFQAVGYAIEDSGGTENVQLGGAKYSITLSLAGGKLQCRVNDTWGTCPTDTYPPKG